MTQQRVEKVGRPTGMDDQNIFSFTVTGFEKDFDFQAMVRDDMALLRQMPGVVDAAPIRQVPLSGSGSSTGFYSLPNKKGEESPATYYADGRTRRQHAGREAVRAAPRSMPSAVEFRKKDAAGLSANRHRQPGPRERAVPQAERAGQDLLRRPEQALPHRRRHRTHARLLGRLGQGGSRDAHARGRARPRHRYIVRTKPGEIDRVMTATERRCASAIRIAWSASCARCPDYKKRSYSGDSLMAVTLTMVTGLVLVFSALGIFGLATFNVNNRTRQIGTRRAVGARKQRHRALLHDGELDGHDAGRRAGLHPGAGRRVLAVHPVPDAPAGSLLPGGRRAGPVGGGPTCCLAALACGPPRCRPPWRRAMSDQHLATAQMCPSLATAGQPRASYA